MDGLIAAIRITRATLVALVAFLSVAAFLTIVFGDFVSNVIGYWHIIPVGGFIAIELAAAIWAFQWAYREMW